MHQRPCLRNREVVLPRQLTCSSQYASDIAGSVRRYLFCSYRITDSITNVVGDGSNMAIGRLSAIHFSSSYRDQLKLLMDDLGGIAGHLDSLGLAAKCGALDDLLDQCNTLESLWNIIEIFSINSGSHCYFEMIRWLQSSIEMTAHISLDERLSFYQRQPRPEIGHMESSGGQFVYWDDIHALVLRGRIGDVWELLLVHSEIRSIVEYTSSAEDRKGLRDLQEIFVSHPIRLIDEFLLSFKEILARVDSSRSTGSASIVDGLTVQDEAAITAFMRDFSSDWMRWHAAVSRMRRDPYSCPLISRMPQLQNVLNVMAGDVNAVGSMCFKYVSQRPDTSLCWHQYALCRLIYSGQTPPPFSKPVVIQMLEESLDFQVDVNKRNGIDEFNIVIARLLQKVLGGQITPVLKFMYELSMNPPIEQYQPVPMKTTHQSSPSMALVDTDDIDTHAVCAAALQGCTLLSASVCAHLLLILHYSEILPAKSSGLFHQNRWSVVPI